MRSKTRVSVVAALALAAIGGASLSGIAVQTPSATATTIEFRALTPDGQPILDLKKEEISLKVNGKAREVKSLELVKLAAAAAAAAPTPAAPSAAPFPVKVTPPFATNATASAGAAATEGSRNVMLVIADESVAPGQEQTLKDALTQLLPTLSPADRITMTSVPHGGASLTATTDRAPVTSSIGAMRGKASAGMSTGERECLALQTLLALKGLFLNLQPADRTTVVFFTAGLAQATAAASSRSSNSASAQADCTITPSEYQNLTNAAALSHANGIVVFLPDAMATTDPTQKSSMTAGVENLASVINASLIRFNGTAAGAMARVAAETSAYYRVGFEPESAERNGTKYRVDLKVTRDRADVRTAPDVAITKPGATMSAKDLTRVPTMFYDLPLRATAFSSLPSPGAEKLTVSTMFEPLEPGTKLNSAFVAIFDDKGKLAAQSVPLESADVQNPPVTLSLLVPPGAYRLRVAATDAAGRTGTVDYELNAGLTPADPGKISSLVLGVPKGGSFSPKLQFGPADAAVIGYLEVYGMPASAVVTVNYELAESVDGPAQATGPGNVAKSTGTDKLIATGGFNISSAPVGDFVMRAVVSVDGKVVARTARTVRKVEK